MAQSDKKLNQGLADYKQAQREETLRRIDEAVKYLHDKGLEVTKKNIAAEIGMHYNTMKKQYITYHLLRYPEFNPDIQITATATNEELEKEIVCLRDNLKKAKLVNKNLSADNARLQLVNKELTDKYQRLLGRYQIDVGKKMISF